MEYIDTMLYDQEFQKIAGWLSRGDRFLAEELRSEMHIATARMRPGEKTGFYLTAAKYRAIDYLISRSINYSYDDQFKHVSLQAIRTMGYQIDTDGEVHRPVMDNTISLEDEEN